MFGLLRANEVPVDVFGLKVWGDHLVGELVVEFHVLLHGLGVDLGGGDSCTGSKVDRPILAETFPYFSIALQALQSLYHTTW